VNAVSIYKSPAGEEAIKDHYNSVLADWPVPKEELVIATRHGQTFIIACGNENGPPLILLHGSGSNSAMWIGDVVDYCQHHRVYAVDIIGEANHSDPSRPDLGGDAYSEWLDDVHCELGLKTASLLGISLGGWIALKYAIAKPAQVDKLVLLCPGGVAPERRAFMLMALPMLLLGQRGVKMMIRYVYGTQDLPQEAVHFAQLIFDNFKPRMGGLPLFSDRELQRLTMPTYLVVGARDVLLNSAETARRIDALLPRAKIKQMQDAGHVLIGLSDEISEFLREYS
jgi:pimeloyl-ACP methyl ester carboxylesterase|tara:strand:+ start:3464 stop:4312 length:849 start_codon:yes stop_codon:yes gene_type:complete